MKNNSIRFSKTILALSVLLLAPRLIFAGTDVWNGGGGSPNLFWLSTANWQAGTLPQAGDQLVFTNTIGLVNSNNYSAGFTFGGITFATPSGAFALAGKSVTLTNNITDNQVVTLETVNLPLIVNSPLNLNLNVTANGLLNLNNVISGTGALTNGGAGTVNLQGSNTFAGPLVINAGTVQVSQETNLPTAPATPTAGNIIINGGTLQALASFTANANHGIAVGPSSGNGQGTISVNDQSLTPNPLAALSYGGVIANNGAGTGGLTKLGFGNLILSGANIYTGTTSNQIGTLTLDFTTAGSPANNVISSSSPLVLGGASAGAGITNFSALVVSNKASTVNSQTFNGTHVTIGNGVIRTVPASSGTINLTLGALDHDAGGILTLITPSVLGGSGNVTTTTANNNGILGGWALIGNGGGLQQGWNRATNYACNDGSGNIVNYTGYTVYNNANNLVNASMAAANNIYVTGITTFFTNNLPGTDSTNDVNSMFFNGISGTFYLGSNNVVRLGQYGGLFKYDTTAGQAWTFGGTNFSTAIFTNSSANGFPVGSTNQSYAQASCGLLTAGGPTYGNPGEIVFMNTSTGSGSANNWQIDPNIVDNGPGGIVTVIKAGSGYTKFDNHNSYSGGTYILGGRLQLSGGDIGSAVHDGLGTGPVYVFPGGYLFGDAPNTPVINIAGIGTVQEPDGAWRLSSALYTNAVVMFGDSGMGGGSPTSPAILMGPVSGNFNMYLGAEGTVGGTGSGIMLSNQCLWTGNTIIVSRLVSSGQAMRLFLDENDALPHGFGKGNLIFGVPAINAANRLAFDLNGFNQTINALLTGFTGVTNVIFNGSNSVTSTLTIGDNDAGGIWGGVIENTDATFTPGGTGIMAITKIGGGVETFTNANTYSGNTTISNGVLALTGVGSIANSPQVNIFGGVFDVSSTSYVIPATQNINVNGGAFYVSTASGSSSPVNFTNGTLKVNSLSQVSPNLTVPTINLGGSANIIQPASIPLIPAYPISFSIMKYTTVLNGNVSTLGLNLPTGYGGYVTNIAASSTVFLVLTNGPVTPLLTWYGFSGGALNSTWDFVASDWTNKPAHTIASYSDSSLVIFDDGGRTNVVRLDVDATPSGVTFANTNVNYTLIGNGGLHGTNGFTKIGTGNLILDNFGTNDFSGGLSIGAGTVQLGVNDMGGSLGGGSVGNNGTLIFDRANSDLVITNSISGSSSGLISNSVATTLTLSGANAIGGSIGIITGSILQAGNNSSLGATNVIPSGASLDVNGKNLGAEQVTVSGMGVLSLDGTTNGAIYNSSATAASPALARVTLTGPTVFGGALDDSGLTASSLSNRWDLRAPGGTTGDPGTASLLTDGGTYKITKIGNNFVGIVSATVSPNIGDIDIQGGTLDMEGNTTGLGNPANTLTVESPATFEMYSATNRLNKNIVVNNNGSIVVGQGANNTIIGAMALNGQANVTVGGNGTLTLNDALGGTGVLNYNGTNTLIVSGTDSHSGGTIVNGGTFLLNTISSSPANVLSNVFFSTIGGNGTNKGPVLVQGTIFPGAGGKPSTFGVGGLLEMDPFSGPVAEFSLGSSTAPGGGVNDLININGNLDANGNVITINEVGPLQNGTYTLINYSGALSSSFSRFANKTVNPTRYTYTLTQGSGVVALQVTGAATQLEWNNLTGDGLWNVAASSNWLNQTTSAQDIFDQLDPVVLDDSIGGQTNIVTINTNSAASTTNNSVTPGVLLVNNSSVNYVINGPGGIVGGSSIVKQGSSTLTINNANAFTGTTTISNGILLINNTNALGGPSAAVIVAGSGTLDVGGASFTAGQAPLLGTEPVFISGMGFNNKGAIIDSSINQQESALENLTLTGDAAIGGDGARWDLGRPTIGSGVLSTGGHPYNLYKAGSNYVAFLGVTLDANLAKIDIQGGVLEFQQAGNSLGNPNSNVVVEAGATLGFYNSTTNLSTYTKQFVLNGNGVAGTITNENGITTLNGSMTLSGNCLIGGGGTALTNNAPMSGTGSLTKVSTGALILTTNETYTGNTIVNGGTLTLVGTASIAQSTNITLLAGSTIDVSGRANGTLTLAGQKLTGSGTINGTLTNNADGIVTPSGGGINSTNALLTVTTNVTLLGTTVMNLNNTNNDVISVGGKLTYGGTLTVTTNTSGTTTLAAGQNFKLFNVSTNGSFNSAFGTLNLPALPAGLNWTNGLAVDGSIGITSSGAGTFSTPPGSLTFSINGANVTIHGTGGQSGDAYYLLVSTNVALPLSQWTVVATNVLGANGNFTFNGTNVVTPGDQQQFYILSNTNSNHQ